MARRSLIFFVVLLGCISSAAAVVHSAAVGPRSPAESMHMPPVPWLLCSRFCSFVLDLVCQALVLLGFDGHAAHCGRGTCDGQSVGKAWCESRLIQLCCSGNGDCLCSNTVVRKVWAVCTCVKLGLWCAASCCALFKPLSFQVGPTG